MRPGGLAWALVLTGCGAPQPGPQFVPEPGAPPAPADVCAGARTLSPDAFAEMTEKLRPGISEADYGPRAEALFGEREASTFVKMSGVCWSGSFVFHGGTLVDVWFDTAKNDQEGLDEAAFQAMRRTANELAAALRKRYGAPVRTSGGPSRLPSANALASSTPKQPFVAAWSTRDVDRCVTLEVSIGKGMRDARLRFQQKPAHHDWAWGC